MEKGAKVDFIIKATAELLTSGCLMVLAASRNTWNAAHTPEETVDKLKPFSK